MMAADLDRARDALQACNPACTRGEWVRLAMAAHAASLSFEDFDAWSARADSYSERATRDLWRSIKPGPVGAGTLFILAKAQGWRPGEPRQHHVPVQQPRQPAPAPTEPKPLSAAELAAWRALGPVRGAGLAYLRARHCVLPPPDGDLRFDPDRRHWPTGYIGPALVALVTDALTREPLTLHFTWIKPDGTKADLDRPRLLLAGHRKAGGVIRLWPDDAVTYSLAVAEGIESALALAHAHAPVWTCIDAGNLAALPVLAGVESLLIGADHDAAGTRAAAACAERWAAADRAVYVVQAPAAGQDLNDLARCAA